MGLENFFDETSEQSTVKTTIVSKYFQAWAKVMIPTIRKIGKDRLAYIDLFSGPGGYKDGTKSTPLIILEMAIKDPDLRQMLVTIFNDKNPENAKSLKEALGNLPGINTLKYRPQIMQEEVGPKIEEAFEQIKLVPALIFIDPWGYKGLSRELIHSVLKDWGCDCILFFNFKRINMALSNKAFEELMFSMFGKERAAALSKLVENLTPEKREPVVLEELFKTLKEIGGKFVLPFCFKNARGTRTSHYLVFVTKHFRGYEIMKEIMAPESTLSDQGVPSFEYCLADKQQPLLFEFTRPLSELGNMLLKEYAGQTISMKEIYERHSIGKPYLCRNYKTVLAQLENEGKIKAKPPAEKRRTTNGKKTFADKVAVIFPKEKT
ncbi:MAG: three-Cys-motif partner protein TcmP [Syntrophorhabdaceae bacterium]|nr:three-Cys-motif partner protein TcmP [Syntrophorhabdaceae bacterium]